MGCVLEPNCGRETVHFIDCAGGGAGVLAAAAPGAPAGGHPPQPPWAWAQQGAPGGEACLQAWVCRACVWPCALASACATISHNFLLTATLGRLSTCPCRSTLAWHSARRAGYSAQWRGGSATRGASAAGGGGQAGPCAALQVGHVLLRFLLPRGATHHPSLQPAPTECAYRGGSVCVPQRRQAPI